MKIESLLTISPLDGRYSKSVEDLRNVVSEYGLITPGEKRKNTRGSYELSWLITSKGKQVAEMNDE